MNPLVYLQCQLGKFHNKSRDESFHDFDLLNLHSLGAARKLNLQMLCILFSPATDFEMWEGLCCSYEVD